MTKKSSKKSSMRERARKKAQEKASSGIPWLKLPNGVELLKIQKGVMKFDVVPYKVSVDTHPEVEEGEEWYQRSVWVHYGVGAEEEQVICPLKTMKMRCPICEHRAELMKDPDADEDVLKDLKPKERELYNIKHDDEFKILTTAYFNFGAKLDEEIREDEEEQFDAFAELKGGYTLKVRFGKETFGSNSFFKASRIDFIPRKKDFPESVLDEVVDLDKALKVLSYDEIHDMYYELGNNNRSNNDEEDEVEEKPKKTTKKDSKKPNKKKKEPEPEPEENEEETESDDAECPIEDAEMGVDFDEYEECDDCPHRGLCESMSEGSNDKENDDVEEESESDDDKENDDVEEESESDDDDDNECPHSHEFGKDCDMHDDDCDDCDCWDKCQDAQAELQKKKAKPKVDPAGRKPKKTVKKKKK